MFQRSSIMTFSYLRKQGSSLASRCPIPRPSLLILHLGLRSSLAPALRAFPTSSHLYRPPPFSKAQCKSHLKCPPPHSPSYQPTCGFPEAPSSDCHCTPPTRPARGCNISHLSPATPDATSAARVLLPTPSRASCGPSRNVYRVEDLIRWL